MVRSSVDGILSTATVVDNVQKTPFHWLSGNQHTLGNQVSHVIQHLLVKQTCSISMLGQHSLCLCINCVVQRQQKGVAIAQLSQVATTAKGTDAPSKQISCNVLKNTTWQLNTNTTKIVKPGYNCYKYYVYYDIYIHYYFTTAHDIVRVTCSYIMLHVQCHVQL